MQYPLKRTFTLFLTTHLFWRKKTIRLEIPQATIRDVAEFSQLSDEKKIIWMTLKISEWGAGKYPSTIINQLGQNVHEIFTDTFFSRKEIERLPDSVVALATKEGIYDYNSPDSVLFATIATEYHIEPQVLLNYTMDELSYLMDALQYKYLNEEQKKELARIKIKKDMIDNKENIQKDIDLLDEYFNNQL